MHVNHSGWNESHGAFNYDVFIDENKQDYALHFADGFVSKQITPFESVTADWNHDGDVYTQFGAWFSSRFGANDFWTPEQMVSALIEGREEAPTKNPNVLLDIPGVSIPAKEKRPLKDTIRQSEIRAANQEAEKNRKMASLGIRQPGEPWAK